MAGTAISWQSKPQSLVALSTTEAEYIAAVETGKDIMWMRQLLGEFGMRVSGASELRVDNQSAISVTHNLEHHGHMKHLDFRYYRLRDVVETGAISPVCVPTHVQVADICHQGPAACANIDRHSRHAGLVSVACDLCRIWGGVLRFGSGSIHGRCAGPCAGPHAGLCAHVRDLRAAHEQPGPCACNCVPDGTQPDLCVQSVRNLSASCAHLLSVCAVCAILLLPGFLLLPCFVRMVTGLLPASLHSRSHRTMIVLLFCCACNEWRQTGKASGLVSCFEVRSKVS